MRFLLSAAFGLYHADLAGDSEKFEEVFSHLKEFCRRMEKAIDGASQRVDSP